MYIVFLTWHTAGSANISSTVGLKIKQTKLKHVLQNEVIWSNDDQIEQTALYTYKLYSYKLD